MVARDKGDHARKSILSAPRKPLIGLAVGRRRIQLERRGGVGCEMDPTRPAALAVGKLQDALIDRRPAGISVGCGQIERAGAVEGEAPAPALAPVPPDPV